MRGLVVIIIAVVLVTLAVVVAAVSPNVSTRLATAMLTEKLGAWSGATVSMRGEPLVTVLPWPGITVTDVEISPVGATGQASYVKIPTLTAALKIVPLFSGRIEVGTLTLAEPEVRLARGGTDTGCVPGWLRDVFASLLTMKTGASSTEVVLSDGAIRIVDCPAGNREELQAVDLNFAWDRTAGTAASFGSFEWRGQKVDLDVEFDEPGQGGVPPLDRGRLTLSAEPAPPRWEGGTDLLQVSTEPGAAGDDDLLPRRLVEELAVPIVEGPSFGRFRIGGQFDLDEHGLRLSHATMDLNGSTAEGALVLVLDGREAMLRGALSVGDLDVTPYLWALAAARSGEIGTAPVSTGLLPQAGIDLRASIDEVSIGGVDLFDAKVSLLARGGHVTFALNEAELAGGTVAGRMIAAPAGSGVDVRLSGRLDEVSMEDVDPAFWSRGRSMLIGSTQPPQGTVTAELELAGEGDTVAEIVASLDGAFAADIRDGSIGGADIISTLERVAQGTLLIADGKPFIPMAGRTHFDRTIASADVRAGTVRVRGVQIIGDRFEISLSGKGSLNRGELEAEGVASLFSSESGDDRLRPEVQLPFGVGGTVLAPMIAPGIPRFGETGALPPARDARPGAAQPVIEDCRLRHIDGEPVCTDTAPSGQQAMGTAFSAGAATVTQADLAP